MKKRGLPPPDENLVPKKLPVERLIVGQLQTNCYLVWDESSGKGIIIDPGDDADYIIRRTRDLNLQPQLIVATHGHFDHVLAVTELKLAFNLSFLMHRADRPVLARTQKTAEYFTGVKTDPAPKVDQFIKERDCLRLGSEKLKVIALPGHSPGGVGFLGRGVVFTGDTLFKQASGRTDLSYSSPKDLKKSLNKLFRLPDKTIVYPGHGELTTIGEQKEYFLRYNLD